MSSSVTLQLAFPKVFVAGFGSFFHARLVNDDSEPLRSPVLTFSCPDFDPPEVSVPFDVIAPGGGYQDVTVSVSPVRAGSRPLGVVVEFSDKDLGSARIATWEGLTIFEKPANEINVTNIIRDVQSHRSSGDKAEFGAVKGDVSINVTNSMGDVRTLNDLLAATFPAQFVSVRLRGFGTTDMFVVSERRRIPPALLRVFEPASVLSLTPRVPAGSAPAAAPLGWRLKGGGQPLVLGRSSQDVDLVTRFMPANPSNDSMSAGMSRRHARLSVCREGRLQVENLTSGNVVVVGSQFVPSGALMQVNPGQQISLGTVPADLRLAVKLLPPPHQEIRVINIHEWSGNTATAHHAEVQHPAWGHAVFTWPNSAPSFWRTAWFTRQVSFGSGGEVAIQLADDPAEDLLSPCHGFFHYLRGCYWLEVISSRGNVTLSDPHVLDGQPFPVLPGQIAPLRGGMTLTLGRNVLDVARVA
ncbi:FHA domain-containing protein [Prosthecobacter sp.]|uniref:FHA domain-containing protein n=1 Tax=Prosthecobacter sp. TaxID=1965333 RepID=UPI003783F1E6